MLFTKHRPFFSGINVLIIFEEYANNTTMQSEMHLQHSSISGGYEWK